MPVEPLTSPVRIEIAPGAAGPLTGEAAARWRALCAANPRLFNGPTLAFVGAEQGTKHATKHGTGGTVVRARREWYANLAVQPEVATGVQQLSVTGVLIAKDAAGAEHVALGRRAAATRVYPGLWELAPSGGIDAPAVGLTELDEGDIHRQLMVEVEEELGLPVAGNDPGVRTRAVCLVHDGVAHSTDVVVRVEVPRVVEELVALAQEPGARWEYSGVRWVRVSEVVGFVRAVGRDGFIAPTLEVLEELGWVRRGEGTSAGGGVNNPA